MKTLWMLMALSLLLIGSAMAWEGIDGWHGEGDWDGRDTANWDNEFAAGGGGAGSDALLLETGDGLLLETGDALLLE